jgi:hypothetical protein
MALVSDCMRVNELHSIKRFPSYETLAEMASWFRSHPTGMLYLGDQFIVDLLVWYHIAWMGETVRRNNAQLTQLMEKGHGYTLHDRRLLLRIIGELLSSVIDRYRVLAENGQVITFDETGCRITDRIQTGRIFIDGKGIGDVGRSVLKERRNLSEDGMVVINMAFDEETGIVVYGPEIASHGFVFQTETGHLLEDAKCVILEIVDETGYDMPNRVDEIRSKVKTALKQYFNFVIKRRPVILPFIVEI